MNRIFECLACKKEYSSISSLSNHNRLFHGIRKHNVEKHYFCKFCKREYAFAQSRWLHQKTCKSKTDDNAGTTENRELTIASQPALDEFEKIRVENEKLKDEKLKYTEEIIRLQKKLLNSNNNIDNKTFKAINKLLMDRSYRNMNNTNSNNVINNTTNNIQILSLGNEDLVNVLTLQQKKMILDSRLGSLEKIVEIAHCGDMRQFKNIIITNLKDNYAYRYDENKGYFITVPKNTAINELICNRVTDIEVIYDELSSANKIDDKTKRVIQDFLDRIENDEPYVDNEIKYDNFKSYKINKIKILLYNNQDRITKDIALLISKSDEAVIEHTYSTTCREIETQQEQQEQQEEDEETQQEQEEDETQEEEEIQE